MPETRKRTESTPLGANALTPIHSLPSVVWKGSVGHQPSTSPLPVCPNRMGLAPPAAAPEVLPVGGVTGVVGLTLDAGFHVGGGGSDAFDAGAAGALGAGTVGKTGGVVPAAD